MSLNEFFEIFLQHLLTPILALFSLITTLIKTKQSSIDNKVSHSLTSLDCFYVDINGVTYCLKDLQIYKKDPR